MHAVLLSGDHPTLPQAEMEALLAIHGGTMQEPVTPRIATVDGGDEALRRLVQQWAWGEVWGDAPDDPAVVGVLAARAEACADGQGSAAVRALRYGPDKSPNRRAVERAVGQALAEAGHTIDLDAPDTEVFAWLGQGRIVIGRQQGGRDPAYLDRVVERRAHFSPISLDPRRAASLVHLACVAPGGRIMDPFCGTGGIVMEAALLGFDAWGSDVDPWMVQGTMTTLADAALEPLDATVLQADIGDVPDRVDGVDGIATDMPYGDASSTQREELSDLYARAFDAFARILPVGGRAVVGHKDAELLKLAPNAGFDVEQVHEEFVHRSMTRRYAVLLRR